jgi:hypothetical protein
MIQNENLSFWSDSQTAAILSVSETQPSRFEVTEITRLDAGLLTYEKAKAEILKQAKTKSLQ